MDKGYLWLTVSNAAERLKRMRAGDCLADIAAYNFSVTANSTVTVECDSVKQIGLDLGGCSLRNNNSNCKHN